MLRVVTVLISALVVAGCSLSGLADFELAQCTSNDQCEALNLTFATDVTDCMRYQCSERQLCELLIVDLDGDEDPPIGCTKVVDGVERPGSDCDDTDPQRSGALAERCDAVDNDCDLVIDEGASPTADGTSIESAVGRPVRFAGSQASGALGVAYADDSGSAGFQVVGSDLTLQGGGTVRFASGFHQNEVELLSGARIVDGCPGVVSKSLAKDLVGDGPNDFELPVQGTASCPAPQVEVADMRDGQYQCMEMFDSGTATTGCEKVSTSVCALQWQCDPDGAATCMGCVPGGSDCPGQLKCGTPRCVGCSRHEHCADQTLCNGYQACITDGPDNNVCAVASGVPPVPCLPEAEAPMCLEEAASCRAPRVAAAGCAASDLAVAGAGEHWFAAAINTKGCAVGQIRLGHFGEDGDLNALLIRGDFRRSTSYLGVDLDLSQTTRCTGASRPEGASLGAASLNLASRVFAGGSRPPQAIAAWIAAPAARGNDYDACASRSSAQVEVIGAWLEKSGATPPARWVTASGNATPQTIGETSGAGRPAMATWTEGAGGYFIAYGAAGGGLALRYLPFLGDPAPLGPVNADSQARETEPIADLGSQELLFPEHAAIDHIALALGATVEGKVDIGLSWQEGCGDNARIFFARTRFDPTAQSHQASEAQVVSDSVGSLPTVAHQQSGFFLPDAERGGKRVDEHSLGGFTVTWTEAIAPLGGPLRMRRFAALDNLPVDAAPVALLKSDGSEVVGKRPIAFSAAGSSSTHALYHLPDGDSGSFRAINLSCGAP